MLKKIGIPLNKGRVASLVYVSCLWYVNGLVEIYWGLTPQQQPGSYQGGEINFLVEETGVPRGNHRPTASN